MSAASFAPPDAASCPRRRWLAFGVWMGLLVLIVVGESLRWLDADERQASLADWLCGSPARWLPFLPWVFVGCCITWPRRSVSRINAIDLSEPSIWNDPVLHWTSRHRRLAWVLAFIVLFIAAAATVGIAGLPVKVDRDQIPIGDMPPAYHDEYSYRLQSETFLAGRTSFPSFEPHSELFDQMHVLNEGRMASRYFPGVGIWLLPGTAVGNPWLMQHVAHALAAWLVFWIGCELSSMRVGLVAGMLMALSPGVLLFSNLLLSHHATLVGLLLFLYAYMRMLRATTCATPCRICNRSWATIAGLSLAFAMLCRPMTAAGFALPMGVWAVWLFGRRLLQRDTRREAIAVFICLGTPIVIGLGVMLWYSQQITGDWRVTPYSLYTETYTPRHVYGFNNVDRGEQRLGPKVLDNYDRWATNLTPALAVKNVGMRLIATGDWTLGIVPILLGVLGLVAFRCAKVVAEERLASLVETDSTRAEPFRRSGATFAERKATMLIIASIITLHLAHVPYWFDGIMHWHYVFETAPLWILLASEGYCRWSQLGQRSGMPGLRWCIAGIVLTALAVNLLTVPALWPGQLAKGMNEISFARARYYAFEQKVDRLRASQRAVVLIIPDPADRSIDYVTNHAGIDSDILRVRWDRDDVSLEELRALFPDRRLIQFDAATLQFETIGR